MNDRDRFDRVFKKSIEYLDSVSALELMNDAQSLGKDIQRDIAHYHLPGLVIIGVLMDEMLSIHSVSESLATERAIMKMGDELKRYLDKNFMKKEKIQENR
ncbi:unnamed protein product [marine sediment metagenome]|uniref:Uncharacterized protein n=1 Tax=marine sediment metagenome TaxID=412755 RepID=X1IX54_9ZZZZ